MKNTTRMTGNYTLTAREAAKLIAPYFPNGLTFDNASEGYNREDIFTYTDGTSLFAVMTCTPDNKRVECIEILDTKEAGSKRHPLTIIIDAAKTETDGTEDDTAEVFTADVMPVEDDDNDETDEPEILGYSKLYNLYHSPHEEKYSYGSMKIGDETLTFDKHKLITISAPKLGLQYDTRTKRFRYNGRIIARNKIIKFLEDKEHAKVEHKAFSEHFCPYRKTSGRFCVNIFADYIDGSDSNHSAHFDYFNQACDFVREAKKFIGTFEDVTCRIVIYLAKIFSVEPLYRREANGLEQYTLPDIGDIKHYSREELQTRVDEIKRAIEENQTFRDTRHESGIDFAVGLANIDLMKAQAFYEFALYETEPAPTAISETDDSNDNDDDEVFNLLPALDELNDCDGEPTAILRVLTEKIYFTAGGNEFSEISVADNTVHFFNGKPNLIFSGKYNAWFSYYACQYGYHAIKGRKIYGMKFTNDEEEFFKIMAERGACTIDEPEPMMTFNDIVANALELCDDMTWNLCDMHDDLTCRRYRRRGNKIRNWYLHRLIRRNAASRTTKFRRTAG